MGRLESKVRDLEKDGALTQFSLEVPTGLGCGCSSIFSGVSMALRGHARAPGS